MKKSLSDINLRYENGMATKVEINQIKILLNNVLHQKNNTSRNLMIQKNMLKLQMGMPFEEELKINQSFDQEIYIEKCKEEDIEVDFYKNRIEYKNARIQKEISISNIKKIKKAS